MTEVKDWLICEGRHYLWWRDDREGYTANLWEAGLYTEAEAKQIEKLRHDPPDRAIHLSNQRNALEAMAVGLARLRAAL